MPERVIIHVDMDALFASVEQQAHPALRGKPIVVCGNPNSRTVVAACSYEAKAFGIIHGMSVWEAKQRCPHVLLLNCAQPYSASLSGAKFNSHQRPLWGVYRAARQCLDSSRSQGARIPDSPPRSVARDSQRTNRPAVLTVNGHAAVTTQRVGSSSRLYPGSQTT